MTTKLTDQDLDMLLRRTLTAVAESSQRAPVPSPRRAPRRGLRVGLAAGAVGVAVATTAGLYFGVGSEYVDRIPPENPIVTGDVDGDRYWLVETNRQDECGAPVPGVELIVESRNRPGQEWNTSGSSYGDHREDDCGMDTTAWLSDPERWDAGGQLVDGIMLVTVAAHPDTTAVRVTLDGTTKTYPAHLVDGARYALVEVPDGTGSSTVSLLQGDRVVPGSTRSDGLPGAEPRS